MHSTRCLARLVVPALILASAPTLRADDPPTPTFTEVTVHDPSVIKAGARWYVYGSHGASAWTEDLMRWTQVATSVNAGNPRHFNTFQSELSELIAWTNADTLWAADVIRLADGRFYYYYNVWTNYQNYRSYMGLAVADGVEGPYADVGEIMKGGTGVTGFDPSIHPNTIDPNVFFDRDGVLWMVYGSYSGGIFILQLDSVADSPNLGRPLPGQGYGTKIMGGNHAQIEGAYIVYSPETEYYYLFVSFGGLAANGGYNIRVFRSQSANGPYFDSAGNNMATTAIPNSLTSTIAPYGVKLMGNAQFLRQTGEPGTNPVGYVSPGHNSAYRDPETGKYLLIFHSRFTGTGEMHQVRVHQMFLNNDGWLVAAPHRYAGETMAPTSAARVIGNYKVINHGRDITSTVKQSTNIALNADGSVSGSMTGTWTLSGGNDMTLALSGVIYRGVFARQWNDAAQAWVMALSALSDNGTAIWGSKHVLNLAPAMVVQPLSQTVVIGSTLTLTAEASGEPAPTYQWRRGGVNIDGGGGGTLTIDAATWTDAGNYTVVATSAAGSVTSQSATVSITKATASVALSDLLRTYTGSPLAPTATTNPAGLPVNLTFDGSTTVPTAAGSYDVVATIDDAIYEGSASTVFRIGPAVSSGQTGPVAATAGGTTSLSVSAEGTATPSFQWQIRRGDSGEWSDLAGATGSTLTIPSVQSFHAGAYRAIVSAGGASTASDPVTVTVAAAAPSDARVQNLSTRALCQTGDDVLIPGFVIEGTGLKRLLMRAVGPELAPFGVGEPLVDPKMVLKRRIEDGTYVDHASNEDWGDNANAADIVAAAASVWAFALDAGSTSAALLMNLAPGTYTIVASGGEGDTGVAIVELYDISATSTDARLVNISNRGFVGVGANVMIPGFIVSEEGPRTFLIRAVGPTLAVAPFNLGGTLSDPVLRIYERDSVTGAERLILTNDNWGENGDADLVRATAASVWAFSLQEGSADAAFVVTLPPGAYTAQASGVGESTGIALVEVYLLD